jgi:malonyl-CoA/methylmalonyl-CoA synthetase
VVRIDDRLRAALSEQPSAAAIEAWERHLGEPVDPSRLRRRLAAGNLSRAFHEAAVEAGDRPALTIEGESTTHRELDRLASRLGAWIRGRGVRPGDRVILAGPGSLGFVVAYLGILRAEAVAVLGSADATERELSHLVSHSGAVAAFAGGDVRERLLALDHGCLLRAVISLNRGAPGPTLEEALGPADVLAPPNHDGDRTAVLGYTSGTTGTPKGAKLSHSNLLASLRGIMLAWRWRDDDVLVHALPLSHQHGLSGLQATLLAGARAVIHAVLDPARLCRAIAAEHATVLFAVPAVYERLLAWEGSTDLSSLRLATSGSAPLSPKLWQRVAGLLGQEPLERYGTTETGLDVSNPYDGPRRPGSVGLPLPGIEVEVADERGRRVAAGKDGEIRLRGPHVFTGYWRDDGATRASFHGGWFRTGDIGRIDPADGYLAITGRLKELIISGGLNVYPREVELVLEEHPSVERAAVVGLPSERWGEEVVALVVPTKGTILDNEELAAHARDALAPHKCPKAILRVDSLPITALGKLQRSAAAEVAARLRRG